jgi:hypothetical protein
MIRNLTAMFALTFCLCLVSLCCAADVKLEKQDGQVTVLVDGKLFTRYIEMSGAKPILWPVVGPTGKEMTRGYPMRPVTEFEKADHHHHRSLWFDHGDVNGISFWHEDGGNGKIVHREYLELASGPCATIRTSNDWIAPDGTRLCEDQRKMVFGADDQRRWIDFDVTVTASDQDIVFGDTKEGSFGIRVAGSMRVEREAGGKIINSEGQTDAQAWGKPAKWVDYSGPVDGQQLGIAILNHPKSLRFPTYWHVRTYGLFAANPFGLHNFKGVDGNPGALPLKKGESFSLYYRVILHKGDAQAANIEVAYDDYAAVPK